MLALIPVMLFAAIMCGALHYWLRQHTLAAEEHANPEDRRRVALLTELTGYIGAVLAVAGGGVAVGQTWGTLSSWDHAAVFGGFAVFFLAIGALVCWVDETAIQRMIGVMWLLSAASASTATGITAHDVYGAAGAQTALATGLSLAVYSTALWLVRRRELQMIALFAGLTIAVSAGILAIAGSPVPWLAIALGLWALGIGWVIVGWQYPEPLWTTVPLGTMIGLIGPSFAVWDHGWVFLLAIATAAAAMAVSISARNTLLLTAGTLAMFGYVATAVVRYFRAPLGLSTSLAACGVLLIAFALVMAWARRTSDRTETGRDTTRSAHQPPGRVSPVGRAPVDVGPAARQRPRLVWPPSEAGFAGQAGLRPTHRPAAATRRGFPRWPLPVRRFRGRAALSNSSGPGTASLGPASRSTPMTSSPRPKWPTTTWSIGSRWRCTSGRRLAHGPPDVDPVLARRHGGASGPPCRPRASTCCPAVP